MNGGPKNDEQLFATQSRIVQFIEQFCSENGFSPTLREIAESTGYNSLSALSYALRVLRSAGVVTYVTGSSRTIRVVGTLHSPARHQPGVYGPEGVSRKVRGQCSKCGAPRSTVPYMWQRSLCIACFRQEANKKQRERYARTHAPRGVKEKA